MYHLFVDLLLIDCLFIYELFCLFMSDICNYDFDCVCYIHYIHIYITYAYMYEFVCVREFVCEHVFI